MPAGGFLLHPAASPAGMRSMDPYAPINGISLERYAELSADVADHVNDRERQAQIVASKGVSRADWEAASAGWIARMQDMSLMGQVATRYMPLYQAALAKKSGGVPTVSFDGFVAMSGAAKAWGMDRMLAHYQIDMPKWTQIAGHWTTQVGQNPLQYGGYGIQVEAEAARLGLGGAPQPVSIGAPAGAPQAQQAPTHGAYAPPVAQGQYGQPYGGQQSYNQQAAELGAQFGNAVNVFGGAVSSFVGSAVATLATGAAVLVQWSDGNRYPATVVSSQGGQVQVAFPDGRQIWVPQNYVTLR